MSAFAGAVLGRLRHRHRFLAAAAVGVAAYGTTPMLEGVLRPILAGDAFFATYLILLLHLMLHADASSIRRRVDEGDAGLGSVVVVTLAVLALGSGAIFQLLNSDSRLSVDMALVAAASVVLGWGTLQSLMALHYAHLFYGDQPGPGRNDRAGLSFPETPEPGMGDFAYFAFTVGMTAQTSDVGVTNVAMRRTVTAHGMAAYFLNTVLLAMAVNAALTTVR